MIIDRPYEEVSIGGGSLCDYIKYDYTRKPEPYREPVLYKHRMIDISFLKCIYADSFEK